MPPMTLARESRAGAWEQTFPADVSVELTSATFAYRFIRLAASFILDKRRLLKDTDKIFINRTIDKLIIPSFEKKNPIGKRLGDKIGALKQAIELRYLREFALVFYKKPDEEDILEVYSFRFMYNNDGEVMLSVETGIGNQEQTENLLTAKFSSVNDTKKQFVDTIKRLHKSIKILDDFPADADASFRISFTDQTPKDFLPEGFHGHDKFYQFDESPTQIGIVCGGHHKVQILAASKLIKDHRKAVDLNVTNDSMNNVTIFAPSPVPQKRVPSKIIGKAHKRKPYGQSVQLSPAMFESQV